MFRQIILTSLLMLRAITAAEPVSVSTFECIGLYWSPENGSENRECRVRYRPAGGTAWRSALPLWFDARDSQYRGSIVNLTPDTVYEIELSLTGTATVAVITATTWTENFPIAQTIYLLAQSGTPLEITQSGSADGYLLYTAAEGSSAVIDVNDQADQCIRVHPDVAYVIIRGLTLKGGSRHGIRLQAGVHDIVVEGCDISNWGAIDSDGWGENYHSAVYAGDNTAVTRIVVQRNRLHHPRSDANSWAEYRALYNSAHPRGPQAVCFKESSGNHVIRYNDVYSDADHYFNDALGGTENFSFQGFPNRDSDIYGNHISHAWDDGIESEGANANVRIWGNYIDRTFVKIAAAATAQGPLYIWRNIAGTSRKSALDPNSDTYERGPFLKAGGKEVGGVWYGSGRSYVFHNTVLQAPPNGGQSYTLGCDGGIEASGGDLYNVISRNNILTNYKHWHTTFRDNTNSCTNNFDYDLYNGEIANQCAGNVHQAHGVALSGNALPIFDPANGEGEFALQSGTPGFDAGVLIPNFTDSYDGAAPDMGAFEANAAPMEFGVNAYTATPMAPLTPAGLRIVR